LTSSFADQELQNIIDKLANFVARNGTKFEEMTRQKQKDNGKFGFLYSGNKYYNYYRWRVSMEIGKDVIGKAYTCILQI
jgi:calcium homeostasis ER protein